MCRRSRVFGRVGRRLFREIGREAFVEGDDGDVRHVVQSVDKALGLAHLISAFAAQCKWKPDDDAIDLVLADQGRQTREPGTGRSLVDDPRRWSQGGGGLAEANAAG